MPTTVPKSVGMTNTPTTMDYSSWSAWDAGRPANLVTADQIWQGRFYDRGKFTAGATIGTGATTDATRYIEAVCETGEGFNQKAGVRTTALLYNATTGAGVATETNGVGTLVLNGQYTRIDGHQLHELGSALPLKLNAANQTAKNCILTRTGGAGVLGLDGSTSDKWINCLFQYGFTSGTAFDGLGQLLNCGFYNTAGAGTSIAVRSEYGQLTAKNTYFLGFGTVVEGGTTLNAASDYNLTDLAAITTSGGGGANNKLSQTFSAQVVSTTIDARAVAQSVGTGLHSGTPDATNSPNDISLTARDGTNPYIGPWEPSGSPPPPPPFVAAKPFLLRQAVNRAATY